MDDIFGLMSIGIDILDTLHFIMIICIRLIFAFHPDWQIIVKEKSSIDIDRWFSMAQQNQSMMGLVLQNPSQNTHMLVNVAGSTGFIGQPSNSMNPMGNMVQMQPQNHPNLHPVSLDWAKLCAPSCRIIMLLFIKFVTQ